MDDSAILAAIAADPESDTPRLIYADWLDDHADQLADPAAARVRAEFIRVQCQIKRYEDLSSAEVQGYADLYRRQDALLTGHRRELLGPLADALGPHDAVFDRGFVTEVRLDAKAFARLADAVAGLKPLPDVTLTGLAHRIKALPDVSHRLELVTAAQVRPDFQIDLFPISPTEVWTAFAGSWSWDRLRELSLEGCRVGDEGMSRLAAAGDGSNLPVLTDLDLSTNEISDEGVRSLVASGLWPRLRRLVLRRNPLSDGAAEVLADAAGTSRLESLNLQNTGLTPNGHRLLLRNFPRRTKLDLF